MATSFYNNQEITVAYFNGKKVYGYLNGDKLWGIDGTVYNVNLKQTTGGTIAATPISGYDGDTVVLSYTINGDYSFNGYNITGATLYDTNKFDFDGSDVTVSGKFVKNSHTLTLQNDGHGTLKAGKTTGYNGDTTTLSATANTNYAFSAYAKSGGGTLSGNTYTFGTSNGTVKATFKEIKHSFYNNSTALDGTTSTAWRTLSYDKALSNMPYLTFKITANMNTDSTSSAHASDIYINSSSGTIIRCRHHYSMSTKAGFIGITNGVTAFTAQSGVTSKTQDGVLYYLTDSNFANASKVYKYVFDCANKKVYCYANGTYMGVGTLNANPNTITKIGALQEVSGRGKITISKIEVVGFASLTDARAY